MRPVHALTLFCVLACGPPARRAERPSSVSAEDADVPVDALPPRDMVRPLAADAARVDDVGPDAPEPDQATAAADAPAAPEPDVGLDATEPPIDGAAAVPCPGYKKGTHTQPGVAADTFCAAYAKRCSYGASPAFHDVADCLATYDGAPATARTCRAGHLCEAIVSTTTSGRSSNCQAAAHGSACP